MTDGRIAATMFSILMAGENISTGFGLGLTGFLSDLADFTIAFFILAALNFLALPLIGVIFKKDVHWLGYSTNEIKAGLFSAFK